MNGTLTRNLTRDQRILAGRKHYETRASRRSKGRRTADATAYESYPLKGGYFARRPGAETLQLRAVMAGVNPR